MDSIQWIISIPAIWSDESKSLMLEWLKVAGIGDKNIENQVKGIYNSSFSSTLYYDKLVISLDTNKLYASQVFCN